MDSQRSLVGTVFAGDYRVESLLAEGGMGALYVAEQRSTGRRRALKLLRAALVTDTNTRERFVREAKVSSRIESDHVVSVIDAGIDADTGVPFIVMELLEGEDLARFVLSHGVLDGATVLEVLRQLCHALSAAHAVGVIHRDLKPENVFIARSRRADVRFTVKLVDFGIAAIIESSATSHATGAIVGSPAWMAPEQVDTGLIRPSTDVWALGLLAFWLFTGRHYWKSANQHGATLQALLVEKLVEPLEPATVRARFLGAEGRIAPALDPWFARCIARDPAARYADASQAIAALQSCLASTTQSDLPPSLAAVAPTVVAGPTGPSGALTPATTSVSSMLAPRRSRAPIALALAALALGSAATAAIVAAKKTSPTTARGEPEIALAPRVTAPEPQRRESAAPPTTPTTIAIADASTNAIAAASTTREPRREAIAPHTTQRAARTLATRGSISTDAPARNTRSTTDSGVAPSVATQPASGPSGGPPGPRPNRCAAYVAIERRANALLDNAATIESTDPRQAIRDRAQAMALREGIDEQVARLRTMARGELSSDPEFVAMVREVDQCVARLRARAP
ncbi:MAG: protein kinase [Myxococcales bacterium]|nr:protein kinase [Myxococcales bacterium]